MMVIDVVLILIQMYICCALDAVVSGIQVNLEQFLSEIKLTLLNPGRNNSNSHLIMSLDETCPL